jgi:UDP-N-acetylmuramyl pentapeptide phosphotransferase/UDP-N-acetylglucosamine-1-phosphate transferase
MAHPFVAVQCSFAALAAFGFVWYNAARSSIQQ